MLASRSPELVKEAFLQLHSEPLVYVKHLQLEAVLLMQKFDLFSWDEIPFGEFVGRKIVDLDIIEFMQFLNTKGCILGRDDFMEWREMKPETKKLIKARISAHNKCKISVGTYGRIEYKVGETAKFVWKGKTTLTPSLLSEIPDNCFYFQAFRLAGKVADTAAKIANGTIVFVNNDWKPTPHKVLFGLQFCCETSLILYNRYLPTYQTDIFDELYRRVFFSTKQFLKFVDCISNPDIDVIHSLIELYNSDPKRLGTILSEYENPNPTIRISIMTGISLGSPQWELVPKPSPIVTIL